MKSPLFNDKIVEKYKIWFALPLVILLIAVCVFTGFAIAGKSFGEGINIGIDFQGGTLLTVQLGKEGAVDNFSENSTKLKKIINDHGVKVSYIQKANANSAENASIVLKYDELSDEQNNAIIDSIRNDFGAALDEDSVSYTHIGASASQSLVWSAVLSVIVSTILILIYVIIRFEFWSGLSAVIALLHDVLMMVCLTIIFHIQINSSFIAALITIVAYSINATIVLFDRVRENYKLDANPISDVREHNKYICNKSVKETFTRNINTSVTTLAAITILAIIGDISIREFALPVIFGLVCGTYSSIVISPSVYCLLKNKFSKKAKMKKEIAQPKKAKA